jgi:hypothetical protein
VQARVNALVKAVGKPAAIEQLKKFGVERASDMKPEKYLEFLAATADLVPKEA